MPGKAIFTINKNDSKCMKKLKRRLIREDRIRIKERKRKLLQREQGREGREQERKKQERRKQEGQEILKETRVRIREKTKIKNKEAKEKRKNMNQANELKLKKEGRRSTLRKYKLSEEDYDIMLKKQNNVCAVCKKINRSGMPLYVDHCHKTGKVRGLLCINCNFALGCAKDDVKILRGLVLYLLNS